MPGRFASLIAPSQYLDKRLAGLSLPEPDFPALARVLRDPEIGNFDQVETTVDQPSAEVRSRVEELFHFRKPYDLLLLYYAGVGLVGAGEQLYLAAADTRLGSLTDTAIAADFICEWMNRSFARRKLLVLDCCYVDLSNVNPGGKVDIRGAFEGGGRWVTVMAAQESTQYALLDGRLVGAARGSAFGDRFLRGLETGDADFDGDGLVSIRELFLYMNASPKKLELAQRSQMWSYGERDELIIAAVPERQRRRGKVKWDLALGAFLVPAMTLLLGWQAEPPFALGAAVFFLLLYGALYLKGD